ncbi:MAG: inner membrane CreD family protein [Candidatus Eisenbacteria bacterium]|nr:inner membrane CreD family protein [Candidatus Eisenbacteria bacterium]
MARHIAALAFIFVCTSFAWMILGATIVARTRDASSTLSGRVASTWGAPHDQAPPTAAVSRRAREPGPASDSAGTRAARTAGNEVTTFLPLERSRIRATLNLEPRRKGLLWYATYRVAFDGSYAFRNTSGAADVSFTFPYPAAGTIYDDLVFTVDGAPVALVHRDGAATGTARAAPGATAVLRVAYRSQGLDAWTYRFGGDVAQVRDFDLAMATDFRGVDFRDNTLSPTRKRASPGGLDLEWSYRNLVTGSQIGLVMPQKLQPGPLAGRISFFAPVSLFFFFFLMFIITTLRRIELHPMNYFFLAGAFFSFHLLLAYLADQVTIHLAFAICSAVSIALVVSYLRLVVGMRFAVVEAGLAQLLYLVLFSYAFFLPGVTGLTVTIGAILTLFVVMQMTGRIRWEERFAAKPGAPPAA